MTAFKLRRGIVYAATGIFFAVAALSQLQGASVTDVLTKATVSCGVLIAFGLLLVRVVEDSGRATIAATTRLPVQRPQRPGRADQAGSGPKDA